MFLHLLRPERKFVGILRATFEAAAPGRHCYVTVGPPEDGFVAPNGVIQVGESGDLSDVLASESDWEGVILNGLSFSIAGSIVDWVPRPVAVAWYVWGYEAYGYWGPLRTRLLLPETQRLRDRLEGPNQSRTGAVNAALRRFHRSERNARKLLARLDYCVTTLREEYDLFRASGLPATVQHHWGLGGGLEDIVDIHDFSEVGDDIQLGNSAWYSNNHLDALPLLAMPALESRRVIVPLGYGNSRYRDAVVVAGREALGDRFCPLVDFIPLVEYRCAVASCGHVIMNHLRQQALGNILGSLWRGARIYMNETEAYSGLRRTGFDVRLISEDLVTATDGRLRAPSDEGTARHRDLLLEEFGRERVIGATKTLLDKMAQKSLLRR